MITIKISDKTRYEYENDTKRLACWDWCVKNFGLPDGERWIWDTHYRFTFKFESDATMFALKWA